MGTTREESSRLVDTPRRAFSCINVLGDFDCLRSYQRIVVYPHPHPSPLLPLESHTNSCSILAEPPLGGRSSLTRVGEISADESSAPPSPVLPPPPSPVPMPSPTSPPALQPLALPSPMPVPVLPPPRSVLICLIMLTASIRCSRDLRTRHDAQVHPACGWNIDSAHCSSCLQSSHSCTRENPPMRAGGLWESIRSTAARRRGGGLLALAPDSDAVSAVSASPTESVSVVDAVSGRDGGGRGGRWAVGIWCPSAEPGPRTWTWRLQNVVAPSLPLST